MHLSIDNEDIVTEDPKRIQMVRAAAYFLLHAIGDMGEETTVPEGTNASVKMTVVDEASTLAKGATIAELFPNAKNLAPVPSPPPVASAVANTSPIPPVPTASAPVSSVPPPPPPAAPTNDSDDDDSPSNVVNFPTAGTVPPPPAANTAAQSIQPPAPVQTAVAAPHVVSAATATTGAIELDSAGMPWDARIHQKGKNKKKDNTWKLIKGIEEKSPGLVQAVTAELAAARKAGAAPPVASPVPLPPVTPSDNRLPPDNGSAIPLVMYPVHVPPVANGTPAPAVPPPPVAAPVSVPPPPAAGAVGTSPYRALIDKITEYIRQQKLAPSKVSELCQLNGAPSLMALNNMPDLIAAVEQSVEAAALGVL